MATIKSAEYIESYRRDHRCPDVDQGCHLGQGALARLREEEAKASIQDSIVLRRPNRSIPLPSASNSFSYPYTQIPFRYPEKPHKMVDSGTVISRNSILVGDQKALAEKEENFRANRREFKPPQRTVSSMSAADVPASEVFQGSSCSTSPIPEAVGVRIMKAEKAERERPKPQAEIGSPLDWPGMPRKRCEGELPPRPFPSIHDRLYYYDDSLRNPFRAPRLADVWGGIDFSFRFLTHPEILPVQGDRIVCERLRHTTVGGGQGRHDKYQRVGRTLYGPTLASYCPANTASPELRRAKEELDEAIKDLEEVKKNNEKEKNFSVEGLDGSSENSNPIKKLLEHEEAKEFSHDGRCATTSEFFLQAPFPPSTFVVNLERLRQQKEREKKSFLLAWVKRKGVVPESEDNLAHECKKKKSVPVEEIVPSESDFRTESCTSECETKCSPDGFTERPFYHTDEVNLARLRLKRQAEKDMALKGFPRQSRRVFALPPMSSSKFRTCAALLKEEEERISKSDQSSTNSVKQEVLDNAFSEESKEVQRKTDKPIENRFDRSFLTPLVPPPCYPSQ